MIEESSSDDHHQLPPGFRFHPTDEELITYYLTNKVSDFNFTTRAVTDVDLNKCEPWDLPAKASMGEREWYFFSVRDRKYPTGLRTNRATEAGYWKTTGKDKEIFRSSNQMEMVGMKKTLVFYRGRAPKGEKTNWVMHEYRLLNHCNKDEWVVCRIFQKTTNSLKARPHHHHQQTPSSPTDELGDLDIEQLPNFTDEPNMAINWNNTNLSTDHAAASPSAWPSLLSTNLSMNSLLLTALQLRRGPTAPHHHPHPHPHHAYSNLMPQPNIINHFQDFTASSNFNMQPSASEQPPNYNDSNIW